MATRSIISARLENGDIITAYCHWDGATLLPILEENYGSLEKARELISLGHMSSLGESIECPEGHSFDTPVKGYSVFMYRDRFQGDPVKGKWSWYSPWVSTSFDKARAMQPDAEYSYEFHGDKWHREKLEMKF